MNTADPASQPPKTSKGTQILLALRYQELLRTGSPLPSFADVEFRNYSQGGEDGILHYVFSLVGTTNRLLVEMCCGNGIECNSTNLILNHGFIGLLVDGDENNIDTARAFYRTQRDSSVCPPTPIRQWITRENINSFLQERRMTGEIDLLSLDLDGNDYWIWEAIDQISPRVVVLEYGNAWGPDEAVSMRYDMNHVTEMVFDDSGPAAPTYGASLAAFIKLGRRKGYRLVGSQRLCYNAFFLRDDVGVGIFPEVAAITCLSHPQALYRRAVLQQSNDTTWQQKFVDV